MRFMIGCAKDADGAKLLLKNSRLPVSEIAFQTGFNSSSYFCKAFKERLDPDTIGGTAFIGLTRPVIKAHGSSGAKAIENAVYRAVTAAEADVAANIAANIDRMKVSL